MGQHFRLDVIHLVIPAVVLRHYQALVLLATLLFVGTLVWYGTAILATVAAQQSPAMNVSMMFPYLAIPVGAALMAFHTIVKIVETLRPGAAAEPGGE
jgi:TRAP-type C4-dicarboxylate transport system permease small subunit